MGGINCNIPQPPSNIKIKDSKEFYDSYTNNLANYSKALFQGIADFYNSNVQIEIAVLSNDKNIDNALQSMLKCEKNFILAQSFLGSVSSIWNLISFEQIDFDNQLENLGLVLQSLPKSISAIKSIIESDSESVQSYIWSRSYITKAFTEVASKINDASDWQIHFAEETTKINLYSITQDIETNVSQNLAKSSLSI